MISYFSNQNIERVMRGDIFGDIEPYSTGDSVKVEDFLHKACKRIIAETKMEFTANFDDHGSGYASYVSCQLYKRNNPLYSETKTTINNARIRHDYLHYHWNNPDQLKAKSAEITEISAGGFTLTINRHIPIAVIGDSIHMESYYNNNVRNGGRCGGPSIEQDEQIFAHYKRELTIVKKYLEIYGITLVEDFALLNQQFDTRFPLFEQNTNVRKGDIPKIFDCLFYWMD